MADKHMFDNDDVFTKDGNIDNTVTLDTSETLATQGNVINSLKIFWARLKTKLVHAITRTDTTKAVGTEYIPVYVDENGEVKQCNGLEKTVSSISSNNINIDNISPIIGTTLSLNVTSNINHPTKLLTINNQKVLYPTGVEVTANISANTNLLVVYNGAGWILINKMNEAKTSGKTSASGAEGNGYSGLMTADDKAKLITIDWNANKYTLPTANSNDLGGVKSKTTGTTQDRYYYVQVNSDGTMKVNVPWTDTIISNWTADLKVGTAQSTSNDNTSGDDNTYIKVVENGQVNGKVKVVGSGSVSVSSTSGGELNIYGEPSHTYTTLKTDNYNANNNNKKGYLVYGPGNSNANTYYFLAGNGSWQNGMLIPIGDSSDNGKILKWGSNGPYWDSLSS